MNAQKTVIIFVIVLIFIFASFVVPVSAGQVGKCYYDECKVYPCPTGAVKLIELSCSDAKCNTGSCLNNSKAPVNNVVANNKTEAETDKNLISQISQLLEQIKKWILSLFSR